MAEGNGKEAPKKGRAKKGEGPYVLSFVDAKSIDSTRIPDEVEAVKITDKANKTKTFSVKSLSPQIMYKLAADGLKRRMDAFIRNGIDATASNSIELAAEVFDSIKAGKLYANKEGGAGGPGRQFDYALWMDVLTRVKKLRKETPPTEAQLEKARLKLESLTPADRNAKIKDMKTKDPIFALAHKEITAERARKNVTKEAVAGYNATADLF